MTIPRTACLALLSAAAIGVLPAAAIDGPMRPGQPEVLARAVRTQTPTASPWPALRGRLALRNRVMLLWQSELDEGITTGYREVETLDVRAHGAAARADGVVDTYAGPVGMTLVGGKGHLRSTSERYVAPDRVVPQRARGELREMESLFMEELRLGGVRFIDRTLATRLAGRNVEGERPNVQRVETRALVDHADYLLQVNAVADSNSRSGRRFHVVLLEVASGEAVLDFHATGEPVDSGPRPFVASDDGFARTTDGAVDAGSAARELALETGRKFAAALPRR